MPKASDAPRGTSAQRNVGSSATAAIASVPSVSQGVKLSISPAYVQRLVAMDIEERQRNERLTRASSASADESLRVMVYWHSQVGSGVPPLSRPFSQTLCPERRPA